MAKHHYLCNCLVQGSWASLLTENALNLTSITKMCWGWADRSAARAGLETDALEKKVAELEGVNVVLQCDLREAELAAGDRDELAARVQALEERLQETRTQHEVLSTYKQVRAPSARVLEATHAGTGVREGDTDERR